MASSDLADKTARAANGVRREIVNLSKHVAGDDLRRRSSNPAGDEIATDVPEVDESRDSLWRAFGNPRENPRARWSPRWSPRRRDRRARAGARVVSGFARRVEEGAFRLLRGAGDDSAAEDAAALERALVECGCASTLDELERLDADASRGWSPTRFHPRGFVAESVLELERLLNLEDPDADDGGDDEGGLAVSRRGRPRTVRSDARGGARRGERVRATTRRAVSGFPPRPTRTRWTRRSRRFARRRRRAWRRSWRRRSRTFSTSPRALSTSPRATGRRPRPRGGASPTSPVRGDDGRELARAPPRRRVAAALNDAEAVVDAYAKARVAGRRRRGIGRGGGRAESSRAREAAELGARRLTTARGCERRPPPRVWRPSSRRRRWRRRRGGRGGDGRGPGVLRARGGGFVS